MKKKLLILLLSFLFKITPAQCYLNSVPSYGAPLSTTGSKDLDQMLSSEAINMTTLFGVGVKLYAYDDGVSPNCKAIPSQSVIMMGKTLMLDQFITTNSKHSITAILAHEFAHILQGKYNLNKNGDWVGKYPELHADYLAGWYMGKKSGLTTNEISAIALGFWNIGDYDYYNINHHGTKYERKFAFLSGFSSSRLSIDEAYVQGQSVAVNINKNMNKTADKYYDTGTCSEKTRIVVNEPQKVGYVTFVLNPKYRKAKIYFINRKTQVSIPELMNAAMSAGGRLGEKLGGTYLCELKRKKVNSVTLTLPSGTYGVVSQTWGSDKYEFISVPVNGNTTVTLPTN